MMNIPRMGGIAVREKYGRDHFSELGKRSAKARKKKKRALMKISQNAQNETNGGGTK